MDRLFAILFVIGLSGLTYLYGVASARFELFPYQFVYEGWLAGKALRKALSEELNHLPGVLSVEASAPSPVPPKSGDASVGELLLVTGWPGVLMDRCPDFGCLAYIMDRQGKIHHVWPIQPDGPWGDTTEMSGFTRIENFYPSSLHLYDNGDLLVSYQGRDMYPYGVGLAMYDKAGKILWKKELLTHHLVSVDAGGRIYAPAHRIIDGPFQIGDTKEQLECDENRIYDDIIYVIDPDGTVIDEISILQSLSDSGLYGLIHMTEEPCDPIHLNGVRALAVEDAPEYPELAAGDLLVSMRNINSLAVIDPSTKRVGGRAEQGGTRLVSINMASRTAETVFPLPDGPSLDFFTRIAGNFDLNAERRRALVVLSMQGRIVEIDLRTGEVIWEYKNVQNIRRYLEARDETSEHDFATFALSAVYYVGRPSFLSSEADLAQSVAAEPRGDYPAPGLEGG
jgi:hypothetical protein